MKKISARTLLASWCIVWGLCLFAVLWQADLADHIQDPGLTGKKLGTQIHEDLNAGSRTGGRRRGAINSRPRFITGALPQKPKLNLI